MAWSNQVGMDGDRPLVGHSNAFDSPLGESTLPRGDLEMTVAGPSPNTDGEENVDEVPAPGE